MKDHLERAAIALLKRVEEEAENGAANMTSLADLANSAVQIVEAAQGKKETAGGTAVFNEAEKRFIHSTAPSNLCNACAHSLIDDEDASAKVCSLDNQKKRGMCSCISYQRIS